VVGPHPIGYPYKKEKISQAQRLMPVILATWDPETGRIMAQGQSQAKSPEAPPGAIKKGFERWRVPVIPAMGEA
jgi:hypothetical protein